MPEDAAPLSPRAELTPREEDALLAQAVVLLGGVPDLAVVLVRTARADLSAG